MATGTDSIRAYDFDFLAVFEREGQAGLAFLSTSEVATEFHLGVTPITDWLKSAEGRGLIEVADRAAGDRRREATWRLTDNGRLLLAKERDRRRVVPISLRARGSEAVLDGLVLALKTGVAATPLLLASWILGILKRPTWFGFVALVLVFLFSLAVLTWRFRKTQSVADEPYWESLARVKEVTAKLEASNRRADDAFARSEAWQVEVERFLEESRVQHDEIERDLGERRQRLDRGQEP